MKLGGTLFGVLIISIIILLSFSLFVISDGEVGVKKRLGEIQDEEIGAGIHLKNPFFDKIYKGNTKLIQIEQSLTVPSKEGLMVDVDVSVIFRIIPEKYSDILQEVNGDITKTLLLPYVRNSVRDVASGYEAKAIYSEDGRKEISEKVQLRVSEKVEEYLILKDILMRKVSLPAKVTAAIEAKIDAEQKSQAKEFELVSAKKDAEIEIARAEGVARSNEIIANSITENYLRYKFIESLNSGNNEVIYVPTEANLPILEAGRFD